MNAIELDLDNPTDLTRALVRIDSVNPDLVPGAIGEAEIATFTNAWLTDRGFEVHTLEATPGRPIIVVVAKGTGGRDSIMLNGHLDTVSLASYENNEGLKDRISDGNIYGRGSFDMKSCVAARVFVWRRTRFPEYVAVSFEIHGMQRWRVDTTMPMLHVSVSKSPRKKSR